jgi:hypothetical protein
MCLPVLLHMPEDALFILWSKKAHFQAACTAAAGGQQPARRGVRDQQHGELQERAGQLRTTGGGPACAARRLALQARQGAA